MVGLVFEVIVVIWERRDAVREWRVYCLIPVFPSTWKFVCELVAAILIFGGVAGEFGVGAKLTAINGTLRTQTGKLRSASDQLLALATQEAGDANDRAAQADLKRVQLENRIADTFGPRQLTPRQSARIAGKLGEVGWLKGIKVDVYVYGVDIPYSLADFEDSRSVAIAVVQTLGLAKMDAAGWLLQSCWGSSASNVVITTAGSKNAAEDFVVGSELIKAFQPEIGTDPNVERDILPWAACQKTSDLDKTKPNHRKNDATINIVVGRKVPPILTREMLEPTKERGNPVARP